MCKVTKHIADLTLSIICSVTERVSVVRSSAARIMLDEASYD